MTGAEPLSNEIAGLRRELAELKEQVAALTSVDPNSAEDRFVVSLNTVHEAPVTGYLAVSPTDGRSGRVELLVGYDDAPTLLIATATAGSDRNYIGAVIREGEKFLLDAHGKQPAFRCVFTPFF